MPKVVTDDQILTSTLDVILQHGYEGATTRLIAAAADINEVTLFRRFGTKDNLVLLAVKHELLAFQQSEIAYSGDLVDDLRRIVSFYDSLFAQRARFIPLIMNEMPRRPVLRAGLAELVTTVHVLTNIIVRYQEAGQLRTEPPLQVILALLAPVLAHHIARNLDPTLDLRFNVNEYISRFLEGHAPSQD